MENYPVHSNLNDHAKEELSPKFQNVGICGTAPALHLGNAFTPGPKVEACIKPALHRQRG